MRDTVQKLKDSGVTYSEGSPEAIYLEAHKQSESALMHAMLEYGVDNGFCGFATVLIKPARGPFVKFCKANGIGDRGVYGGWELGSYEMFHYTGQSMDVKEEAARMFAKVLRDNGIKAWMKSRAD